jgi:hypothetical protein
MSQGSQRGQFFGRWQALAVEIRAGWGKRERQGSPGEGFQLLGVQRMNQIAQEV